MKITIHNRFAETLNMEGRRGEKLAFGKYKVCTTIIGNLNIYIYNILLKFMFIFYVPIK